MTHILLYSGLIVLFTVILFVLYGISRSIRYVRNDRVAIVEKLWSGKGSLTGGFIALNGEAGFQPEVLRGGYHFFFPFQYRIHVESLVTIPQGQLGYIFARDGLPLKPSQTLATSLKPSDFLDVRQFLTDGGQKGVQRTILGPGTYAINLAMFVIISAEQIYGLMLENSDQKLFNDMKTVITERNGFNAVVIRDKDDSIGIVTVHDGPALAAGHIIAPEVGSDSNDLTTFHNSFQDPEKFLAAGGRRGRQLQTLLDGTYILNRLFVTVELVPKTTVEVGYVGVVISYTGDAGIDTSGEDYRHGELVARGSKGVWSEPLMPGKYAWNTYAGKVTMVPTTNFMLKWQDDTTGSHRLDENLSEISLITKDAFEPILPLSVVVHIDYKKAPLVIQRFGNIKTLIEQTLDPMVSAYFKNVGQQKTLIELLQERSDIQDQAGVEMRAKFDEYNLEFQEVLIGTPRPGPTDNKIEQVLDQLRSRQVAKEQMETYKQKEEAATTEKTLRVAEAHAAQAGSITQSELSVIIQENEGKASAKRAIQRADEMRTTAQADADRIRITGEGEAAKIVAMASAEAERITRIGKATADTIAAQVEASGGPRYQLTRQIVERISTALETSGVDIVPRVQINGSGGNGDSNGTIQGMLAMLMSEKFDNLLPEAADKTPSEVIPTK